MGGEKGKRKEKERGKKRPQNPSIPRVQMLSEQQTQNQPSSLPPFSSSSAPGTFSPHWFQLGSKTIPAMRLQLALHMPWDLAVQDASVQLLRGE